MGSKWRQEYKNETQTATESAHWEWETHTQISPDFSVQDMSSIPMANGSPIIGKERWLAPLEYAYGQLIAMLPVVPTFF